MGKGSRPRKTKTRAQGKPHPLSAGARTPSGRKRRRAPAIDKGTPELQRRRKGLGAHHQTDNVMDRMLAADLISTAEANAASIYRRAHGALFGISGATVSQLHHEAHGMDASPDDVLKAEQRRYEQGHRALKLVRSDVEVWRAAIANQPPDDLATLQRGLKALAAMYFHGAAI